MANDEVVNFDTMRDMVLNTTEKGPIDPKKMRSSTLRDKFNQKNASNSNGIPKRET